MDYRSSRVCRSRGGRQGVRLAYDAVVFTGLSANSGGAGRECADTAVTRVESCFPVLPRVQIAGGPAGSASGTAEARVETLVPPTRVTPPLSVFSPR